MFQGPVLRTGLTAPLLAWAVSTAFAPEARAFAFNEAFGPPPAASAPRWGWNQGLSDGLSVAVHPDFATDLGATNQAEIDLVHQVVLDAVAAWASPVLAFEVRIGEAGVVAGPTLGFEVDVFTRGDTEFPFAGNSFFGFADLDIRNTGDQRLLTNGAMVVGTRIAGADLYVNRDAVLSLASAYGFTQQEQLDVLQRLLMHEFGHVLGLGHPNDNNPIDPSVNWDTDDDPLNAIFVDPARPFDDIVPFAPNRDNEAIMSNRPCGEPFPGPCPALFFTGLRNDDVGGRDVLYPIPRQTVLPGDLLATLDDGMQRAVLRIDLATGNRVVVSCSSGGMGCSVGAGPGFESVEALVAKPGGDILLVNGTISEDVVLRVDPVTGDRTLVSSSAMGTGPSMRLFGLALEPSGDLVGTDQDTTERSVLRIDPTTGDRTRVSCTSGGMGCSIGAGPGFQGLEVLVVEPGGDVLLVDGTISEDVVLRVNPVTGDRTLVSSSAMGTGPSMRLFGLALEPSGDLVGTDENTTERSVLRIDPGTGDRTQVSCTSAGMGCSIGAGPEFEGLEAVVVETDGDIFVVNATVSEDEIIRVDPVTGDRTVVASSLVGAGSTPMRLVDLALVPAVEAVPVFAGTPANASALGGSALPGGVDVQLADTFGGTFSAQFLNPPLAEAQNLLASPGSVDFVIPFDPYQFWELSYAGSFTGLATLTFHYDDTNLDPADEASLVIEQFQAGMWVALPVVARDAAANTITVETNAFSPFVLGLPAVPASGWVFSGTAAGGRLELLIGAVLVSVTTTAGQSASDVATAVAAAINANPVLAAAGITATAGGAEVQTNGLVLSTRSDDAGLDFELLFVTEVPALGALGLALLALLVAALGRPLAGR